MRSHLLFFVFFTDNNKKIYKNLHLFTYLYTFVAVNIAFTTICKKT